MWGFHTNNKVQLKLSRCEEINTLHIHWLSFSQWYYTHFRIGHYNITRSVSISCSPPLFFLGCAVHWRVRKRPYNELHGHPCTGKAITTTMQVWGVGSKLACACDKNTKHPVGTLPPHPVGINYFLLTARVPIPDRDYELQKHRPGNITTVNPVDYPDRDYILHTRSGLLPKPGRDYC